MSKFRLKKSGSGDQKTPKIKEKQARNWGIVATLFTIVLVALILRVFFAYDYAVAGGYALSGGTDAAYHLRSIEYILEHGSQLITDPALNYPFGQLNPNPFLMDWVFAGFASVVTLFGVSTSTAAAGTLVWGTAILGAVTCIPVYLIGREMFNKVAGIVAALLYAVCAMAISNTVMSNGTVAAFYGFLFALMILALVKAVKALGNERPEDQKDNILKTNKAAVKYAIISGLLLALVALSWNGFRPIVVMIAAMMIVHAVLNRIRRKDGAPLFTVYALTLLVGMLIAAPFYYMQELWDLVFSGPFFFALIAVGAAFIITYMRKQPWLLVVSIVTIIVAVFFVILSFVASDLFSDILFGNALYFDPTYKELVASNFITLSSMAGYYGWLTLWLPYILIAYMAYKLPEKIGSAKHMFVMMWMISMMFISWASVTTAFLAAPAYAVGGGAVLVWIIYKANIREYFANFRGSGFHFRTLLKKFFRPVPLLTVLMALFLVGAPNAVYALDSSISSNEKAEMGENYLGAMGYFVRNDTDWTMNDVWKSLDVDADDGALVSWWDYSPDAANSGNLNNIAGLNGAGASAASNILLADADRGYLVAMTIRLMSEQNMDDFKTVLMNYMLAAQFDRLKEIMENPAAEKSKILNNPDTYGRFSSNLSDENAMYISAMHYITTELGMSQTDCVLMYEDITAVNGEKISYFAVSRSMFPIVYNDNSAFSTLAFMNNYVLDSNGAPTSFYSINYYGYYDYTDAMYNTLLWRTYIGPAPADYGYTSAIAMFNALSLSDGSPGTMAQPGFGVPNTEIAYWKVMYHAPAAPGEDDITVNSDGWVEMDALGPNGAIQKQKDNPGSLINYMSGLPIVLKFVEGSVHQVTGTVMTDTIPTKPVKGARVAVFDANGIQKNTVFTDDHGEYTVDAPFAGGRIEVSLGSTTMRGGLVIEEGTIADIRASPHIKVKPVEFKGEIYFDDGEDAPRTPVAGVDYTVTIEGAVHGGKASVDTNNGKFTFDVTKGLVPDKYTITVREGSLTVATGTYEATLGRGGEIQVELVFTKTTIKLDITDQWGNPITSISAADDSADGTGYVQLTNTANTSYAPIVKLTDGKGEAQVIPGTYIATLVGESAPTSNEKRELFNATATVKLGGTETITAKGQEYHTIDVSIVSLSAIESALPIVLQVSTGTITVTTILDASMEIKVPASLITNNTDTTNYYSIYGLLSVGGVQKVLYKQWDFQSSSGPMSLDDIDAFEAYELKGSFKDKASKDTTGTVMVFDKDTGAFVTSIWADGEYSIFLPRNFDSNNDGDDFTVYAYNNANKEAYIDNLTVADGATEVDYNIELKDAEKLTVRIVASTTTSSVPNFQNVPIRIENDATVTEDPEFMMRISTTAAGTLEIFLPKTKYVVSIPAELGDPADPFVMAGTAAGDLISRDVTISAAKSETFYTKDPTYYVGTLKFVDQNGDPITDTIEFKVGSLGPFEATGGSYTFTAADEVPIGSYTVTVKPGDDNALGATQLYQFSGSVLFSLSNMVSGIETKITSLYTMEFTGIVDDDHDIEIEKMGKPIGTFIRDEDKTKHIYYFEKGFEFQVKVTDKAKTKIWYFYVSESTALLTPQAIGLTNAITVSGYAGFASSGIVVVNQGAENIVVTVSSTGKYEVTLPTLASYNFNSYLGYDEDPLTAAYKGERLGETFTGDGPNYTLNIASIGKPIVNPADIKFTPDLTGITYNPATGEFSFKVDVTGWTGFNSFMLSGGSAWDWVKFYGDAAFSNEIDHVISSTTSFWMKGKLVDGKALDDNNLTIILSDPTGNVVTTGNLDLNAVSLGALVTDGDVTIGRGEFDRVSEFEHRFSISVKNDTLSSKDVRINFNGIDTPDGWLVVITDENGTTIRTYNDATVFSVPGKTTATFYVKFMTKGGSVDLPTNFEVKTELISTITGQVIAGEKSTAAGNVVITTVTPTSVDLNTDGNDASGPNVFTEGSKISTTTWALVILAVVILMFILWQGTKRGVFSRRR